jgi:TetR/AcrR family transcriptional repressor of nem operon
LEERGAKISEFLLPILPLLITYKPVGMTKPIKTPRAPRETRQKLVAAARTLVLRQGFTGSGVDQICEAAGVTKGAFFHHFKSKDDIGRAVLADWADFGMGIYRTAKVEPARYPLDHVHRFFEIMIGFLQNSPSPVTCVVGIMSQELALANPALRAVCSNHLGEWADFARKLLDEAKAAQPPEVDFDSNDVVWFLNSLWQGSMLISKTRQDPTIAIRNLERARAEIDRLFGEAATRPTKVQNFSTNPTTKHHVQTQHRSTLSYVPRPLRRGP